MLTEFIGAALRKAHYEILPEGEGYYGAIEGFQGVWAQADSLEACRDECRTCGHPSRQRFAPQGTSLVAGSPSGSHRIRSDRRRRCPDLTRGNLRRRAVGDLAGVGYLVPVANS
jgi:hypothetical protein